MSAVSDIATRQRVLEAAGEVFARQGFARATVREICRAAHANVAAVNYHFRDKGALYEAVLDYGYKLALEKYPPDSGLEAEANPEERLHAFVRSFLFRLLAEGGPAWHGKLMARELAEPTGVLDKKVEQYIRPLFRLLTEILRSFVGEHAQEALVRRCGRSIVGQVLFYRHAQPVLMCLEPDLKYNTAAIEQFARHITDFSAAALKALAKGRK